MEKRAQKIYGRENGFTLVELLISVAILTISILSILLIYIYSMELREMSRNYAVATSAARDRMETIKQTTYLEIPSTFNNVNFTASGINGNGTSFVTDIDSKLVEVVIYFCWQEQRGLVIGTYGTGSRCTSSPVQLRTQIYGETE